MTPTLDGTVIEEFAINVSEYLRLQSIAKEADKNLKEMNAVLKGHMIANGLSEVEVGDNVVTLLEFVKTTVDSKVAQVVIPKKYLAQILKTTNVQQLRIGRKKV